MTSTSNNDAISRAYLYFQHGELAAAHAILQPLALQGAADFNLLHLSGAVAAGLQLHAQAIDWFSRALMLSPGELAVSYKLGRAYYDAGRHDDALGLYLRLIAAGVQHVDVYVAAANLLQQSRRDEEARQTLEHALQLAPQTADLWRRHAVSLTRLHRHDDALHSMQQALALAPGDAEYRLDLALALYRLHRNEEALACVDHALAMNPQAADAWSCRAAILSRLCRYQESIGASEKALAFKPGDADAGVNLALARMTLGQLDSAWQLYESRWQGELADLPRHDEIPRWTATQAATGKTILLWAEQGLGDTIQFCRYARQVAALGGQVVLEVPIALKSLLQTLADAAAGGGNITVLAFGEALPAADFQLPLMSLPGVFDTSLENMPAASPYLRADALKQARWRATFTPGKRLRIGLVCSGNPGNHNDRRRSMALDAFAPLLAANPDCDFVLVQTELRRQDEAFLQATPALSWPAPQLQAFDDTAALLAGLDLVITVDTAAAHLAGALGVPVWILLSKAADWRWFRERSDSPWYQSARLFRQSKAGQWDDVIGQVQAALAGMR